MGMGLQLAGAAGGAAKSLEELLAQRQLEAYRQATLQQQAQAEANRSALAQERIGLTRTQMADDEADRTGQRERQVRQDERQATIDQQGANMRGLDIMAKEKALQPVDPNAELKDYEAKKKIDAKYRPKSGGGLERVIPVQTMENGKRVTKYLPESQVRGQTFESPSGGPTLASGQQRRIMNFYSRMKDASETVDGIEPTIAAQGPMARAQGQYGMNIMQTAEQQSYRQAQRAFTEARLRKESGAAIPPHEYENDAMTYFAQPGDKPETIAQKKTKRAALLESTAFEAGPAYEEFTGEKFQRSGGVAPGTTAQLPLKGQKKTFPNGRTATHDGVGWVPD